MKDFNKELEKSIIDFEKFIIFATKVSRHIGFIKLTTGETAEVTININTDTNEWIYDERDN